MHPDILSTTSPVLFTPVRHHSPACARMVRELALACRPRAILIEGPADFNEHLDELLLPHQLPIAIYSYVKLADQRRRGAFYPFCEHSPEWAALQTASELGIPAQFIDLPWAELAATERTTHRYADGELRTSPYVPMLCQKLGVEDFDALWDLLVEVDASLTPVAVFERVQQLCYHLRAATPHISAEDHRREAFMLAQIHVAQAHYGTPLMVVTGGFHSSALFAGLTDSVLPSVQHASVEEAASVLERGIALTPYTDQRLDSLTGYDAGMPSPGFYRQIWRDRSIGQHNSYRQLLADAAGSLRTRGQIASTADLIAVETTARGLAALRGHPEVWRRDLVDGCLGALLKEAIEPDTRHPLLDALLARFRGNQRGTLASGTRQPPLVEDTQQQLQQHGLVPEEQQRQVQLELTDQTDLRRSRTLQRLCALGIVGFTRTGGANLAVRTDLSQLWETWLIRWVPEQDAAMIEAAIYGTTLEEAAAARLRQRAAGIERNAEQAALLLLDACLMGLLQQADDLFSRVTALIHTDGSFLGVGAALEHLLYLFRYDAILGVAGRNDLGALLGEAFRRTLWLLERQSQPAGAERAMLQIIRALVQTYESCAVTLALDHEVLVEALARTGSDTTRPALVRGATSGALWVLRANTTEQVLADLRTCADPAQLGDFLTGLFGLAREAAQRDPTLVASIDTLVCAYDDNAFLQALPALRMAFTFFTPREKHYLAHTLAAPTDEHALLPDHPIDLASSSRALALEAWVSDMIRRYGIRGGSHG